MDLHPTHFEPSSLGTRPRTGTHGVLFDTQSTLGTNSAVPVDAERFCGVANATMALALLLGPLQPGAGPRRMTP
jgi:hypothetical protein